MFKQVLEKQLRLNLLWGGFKYVQHQPDESQKRFGGLRGELTSMVAVGKRV